MEGMILRHVPDFTVLTQTWLIDAIYDNAFVPTGYSVLRKDRGSRGGGVCINFKSFLNLISTPEMLHIEILKTSFARRANANIITSLQLFIDVLGLTFLFSIV